MGPQQEKMEIWQSRVALAEQHSVGIKAFCREQGISFSTFAYWRKKLRPTRRARVASKFVPIAVKREERRVPDPKWLAEFILCLSGAN